MDYDDFNALFDGKGTKIQSTPNNKPRSIKTIIEFQDWNAVKELFDGYGVEIDQEIEVSYWRMGSIFRGQSLCFSFFIANCGFCHVCNM